MFEPHVQTNGRPEVFFFFFREIVVAAVFFRIVASVRYLWKNYKITPAGFPVVGWCMMNTAVSKNHVQICEILNGAWSICRSGNILAGPARVYEIRREVRGVCEA